MARSTDFGERTAKEAYVLSIAPFSRDRYFARPVLLMATCKAGSREMQRLIIERVEDVWDEMGLDEEHGEIWSAYSDGDAPRRQAFVDSEVSEIDPASALGKKLEGLELLHRAVARRNRTRAFDAKHAMKRARGVFKSATRGTVIGAVGDFKHTAASTKMV
jgi:hypothetical protein